MSKDGNWIKVNRGLLEQPFWNEKPFSKGQAWMDLLLTVHWKNGYDRVGRYKRKAKAGQLWITYQGLADRWGWHKENVRRFLTQLECDATVTLYATAYGTLLTLKNWELYQHGVTDDVTQDVTIPEKPTYKIKNKEREEGLPPSGDDDPDDRGMTEEELRAFLQV